MKMNAMTPPAHRFSPDRAIRRTLKILAVIALHLGAFMAGTQAQNLIVNGQFEGVGGPFEAGEGAMAKGFLGWTTIAAAVGSDFGVGDTNAGFMSDYYVSFGATSTDFDTIAQAVDTIDRPLLKGVYQITFWLKDVGNPPAQFQALWNGRVVYNTVNSGAFPYQPFVIDVVAASKSSTLAFQAYQIPAFYHLSDVSLTLVGLEQGSFAQFARTRNLTPNQRSVANALDSAAPDPKSGRLLRFLDYRPLSELPGDFDKIGPAGLTSIFAISTSYAQVQSLNLQRRTDDIRSGASGFSAANLAINADVPSYSGAFDITSGVAGPNGGTFGAGNAFALGDDGKEVKETKEVAPAENRWGAFLSGTGEWVNVDGTGNARGYDLASGGFTLGVDYKVCPNFAIGLAAGYTGTTADLADHGRVWTNGGKLGLYSTTFVGGWYADAAGFGGYNGYDTRRSTIEGHARGSTDGGEVDALFGTGYDFKKGGLTFGPTGTFNYTYAGMNGFTEHNSLTPLSIHGGDEDSLRTAFGFKLSYDCKCGGMLIKPELRAAWQHEFGADAYSLASNFADGAGGTFTVDGPKLGRDSALLGAGFAIQINDHVATYLYYDGEVGRRNYDSSAVTGGVRVAF